MYSVQCLVCSVQCAVCSDSLRAAITQLLGWLPAESQVGDFLLSQPTNKYQRAVISVLFQCFSSMDSQLSNTPDQINGICMLRHSFVQ